MKSKRFFSLFLILMLLVVSCSKKDEEETSTLVDEAPIDSHVEAVPTPSIDEGLRVNDAHIGYEGIGFGYATGLIDSFDGRKVASYSDFGPFYDSRTVFENMPDNLEIALRVQGEEGWVNVQPIHDAAGQFFESFRPSDLQRIAAIENDVNVQAGAAEIVPHPPKLNYLPFVNGNGRRYLTFNPTNESNGQLYYLFEGVTATGRHLVWFAYPITTTYLDDLATDTPIETILQQLDDLPTTLFTPNLAQLDQIAESLQVEVTDSFDHRFSAEDEAVGKLMVEYSEQSPLSTLDLYLVDVADGEVAAGRAITSVASDTLHEIELPVGNYQLFAHDPLSNALVFYGYWGDNQTSLQTISVLGGQASKPVTLTQPQNPCSQTLPASADGKYQATNSNAIQIRIGCIAAVSADARTHVVQAGDTLYNIAEQRGVDWRQFAEVNGIFWPYTIQVGQELVFPR